MTVEQLADLEAAVEAIGPDVWDLRAALTLLNRAAAQLEFMIGEVEVRQEDIT